MGGGQQSTGIFQANEMRRRGPAVWSYTKGAGARDLTDFDQKKKRTREKS